MPAKAKPETIAEYINASPAEARAVKFETSAGTIRFPLDRPLPPALIRKLARFRVKAAAEKDAKWM